MSIYSDSNFVKCVLCDNFSFSILKVEMTTPTNIFKMNRADTKIEPTKYRIFSGWLFSIGIS